MSHVDKTHLFAFGAVLMPAWSVVLGFALKAIFDKRYVRQPEDEKPESRPW